MLCTVLLMPMSGLLEKLANRIVPDALTLEVVPELDERLLATPSIALENCRNVTMDMAKTSFSALRESLSSLNLYSPELAKSVREKENKTDYYEDILGLTL